MPIYSFHCTTCDEVYDELCKMGAGSSKCPDCGEADVDKLQKQLSLPQSPKIQSGAPTERWGYNKTTTDFFFGGDGLRIENQYDENKQKAQKKEAIAKQAAKGATVGGVALPSTKTKTK
jgi:putative FmdB family regulatory protein